MDLHSKIKINGKRSLVKFMNYQNIDDTLHFLYCFRLFYFTAYCLSQLFCIDYENHKRYDLQLECNRTSSMFSKRNHSCLRWGGGTAETVHNQSCI